MATIVSVDPGLRACGVAITRAAHLEPAELLAAALVKNPEREAEGAPAFDRMAHAVWLWANGAICEVIERGLLDRSGRVDALIVERQRIYPPRRGGGGPFGSGTANPNVILDLASVVGGICATVPARFKLTIQPSQWKGSGRGANKAENNRGILAQLSAAELSRAEGLELKTTGHNVIDAIGIGKWAATKLRLWRL